LGHLSVVEFGAGSGAGTHGQTIAKFRIVGKSVPGGGQSRGIAHWNGQA
jgi:hypothetical protein